MLSLIFANLSDKEGMKRTLLAFFVLLFSANLLAQSDTGVPTTSSGGGAQSTPGKRTNAEELAGQAALLIQHNTLVNNFSAQWEKCGGELGELELAPNFYSVQTNLILIYEASRKAGLQPNCEDCQKRASRFQCLLNDDGLGELREFVNHPDVLEFIKRKYDLNQRKAKHMLAPLKEILNDKTVQEAEKLYKVKNKK